MARAARCRRRSRRRRRRSRTRPAGDRDRARRRRAAGGRSRRSGAYTPGSASCSVWSIVSLCWCSCWSTSSQTHGRRRSPVRGHRRSERSRTRLHVVERLGPAQVGQVAAVGARGLGGVVDLGQVGPQQLEPAGPVAEPEVLEGRDVAEVPDQRAHQRVVHAVEILVGDRLDQRQRALAGLGEQRFDPLLEQRLGPSKGQCVTDWTGQDGPGVDPTPRLTPSAPRRCLLAHALHEERDAHQRAPLVQVVAAQAGARPRPRP